MSQPSVVRRLAAASLPLLLAGLLVACGSDGGSGDDPGGSDGSGGSAAQGGPPTDASKADFCEGYENEGDDAEFDEDGTPEKQAEQLKDTFDKAAASLSSTGTPQDIPDDAREGFEAFIDALESLDEDEIRKAIEDQSLGSLTDDFDEGKVETFTTWASDYCA